MFLITGATGNVGGAILPLLRAEGAAVRGVTRDPAKARFPEGVEAVRADLADPSSLGSALDGVEAVFLNPAVAFGGTDLTPLITAFRDAGVRRIVLLSSGSVRDGEEPEGAIAVLHATAEAIIRESGLEWTAVRPGEFAANSATQWGPQLRRGDVIRGPFAAAQAAPIHEKDIAAVAAKALLTDDHLGSVLELSGPELLTFTDKAAILGEVLGRPIRYEEIPEEAARAGMVAAGLPEAIADTLLTDLRKAVDTPHPLTQTVEKVAGRPAYSYRRWAEDRAADFTA